MSTDEKYLLSLKGFRKNKPISWDNFLNRVSSFHPTKPENIFLLLHNKGWIHIQAYQPVIDKIKMDMSFGYSPSFNHLYFIIPDKGYQLIQELYHNKLLKENKQLKLDI